MKKLKELFTRAKENSPSIIFIDEMDGLLPRNNGFQSQHDIQLVEQARSLISELEPQHNVFLTGTTNHLGSIDAAIVGLARRITLGAWWSEFHQVTE